MNLTEATYMLKKAGAKLIKEDADEDAEVSRYRFGLRVRRAIQALSARLTDDPDSKIGEATERLIASTFEALDPDPELEGCYVVIDGNRLQHGKTSKVTTVTFNKYEQPSKQFTLKSPQDLLDILKELQDKVEQGEDIDIYAVLANNSK